MTTPESDSGELDPVAWKINHTHTEVPTYTTVRELAEAYRDHEHATITPLYPPSALAAAEQRGREMAAKIADAYAAEFPAYPEFDESYNVAKTIAAAIRGDKTGGGNG